MASTPCLIQVLSSAAETRMLRVPKDERIAIIGYGAIGQRVYTSIRSFLPSSTTIALLVRSNVQSALEAVAPDLVFENVDELLEWKPTLAIECAGHSAVSTSVAALLERGTDVILASIGALGDEDLRQALSTAAERGNASLTIISGGIGALDALSAARLGGLEFVTYTGRKKPAAWLGTPAEERFDLRGLTVPTVIFAGNAVDAARQYPKNANVTAATALAGVGFEATQVELIADPTITQNVHEVHARGAFGELSLRIANNPLPENPRTSLLAALSIEAKIRMRFERIML